MRMPAIVLLSGLSALAVGCSVDVLHYGAKNLVYAPCNRLNGAKECAKAKALAEESWRRFQGCNPGVKYSKDFADGYVFGFADYVEKGGGIPPVVAPLHYRKVRYETPEGHQQISDWFAGCRAGIAAGMASGYREYVVLPMSVPPKRDPGTYGMQEMAPGAEMEPVLPPPKPVAPEKVAPPVPVPVPPTEPTSAGVPLAAPPSAVVPPSAAPVPSPAPLTAPTSAPPPGATPVPPPATPRSLPPADARQPGFERSVPIGVRAEPAPGPRASVWPEAAPTYRTTPPPPVRPTLPPPWEDAKPTPPAVTSPSVDAQRLAAALPPATPVETPLGDRSPVDTGVWMPARSSARKEVPTSQAPPAGPKPIAIGQPANVAAPTSSGLRSEAPPPPNPDDAPAVIVSHRGARWQN